MGSQSRFSDPRGFGGDRDSISQLQPEGEQMSENPTSFVENRLETNSDSHQQLRMA